MKKKLLLLLFILIINKSFTQIKVYTDTNTIKIGGQFNLFLEIDAKKEDKVTFFIPNDTVNKFEIVKFKIDTIKNEENIKYVEKILLTGFTQGSFYIEPIEIKINDKIYITNRIPLVIDGVEIDTNKPFFDIKNIINIPYTLLELLLFLFYVVIILGILYLLYYFFFLRNKESENKEVLKEIIPPYILAKQNIEKLKEKHLLEKEKYKEFYTELTDIIRIYLEGEFGIDAMEYTSKQIIKEIKNNINLDKKIFEDLSNMLEYSDLVKFAKLTPIISEAKMNLEFVSFLIDELNSKIINTETENGTK